MGKIKVGAEFLACYPKDTETISVTGKNCALKCAHCGGHYLSKMTPLEKMITTFCFKGKSALISGGCDKSGKVNFMPNLDKLKIIKGLHRYNFHVGLLNEEEIKAIVSLADVVSFDFLGANSTIKNTMKLDKTVEDYLACFRLLKKYCKHVVPHICVGLEGGKIVGEYKALELLAKENVKELVFIVLIPTKGTEYENVSPPEVNEVIELIKKARELMPNASLILGCMRPGGSYRRELDLKAVEIGINGIVNPTKEALEKVKELNLTLVESRECCVL